MFRRRHIHFSECYGIRIGQCTSLSRHCTIDLQVDGAMARWRDSGSTMVRWRWRDRASSHRYRAIALSSSRHRAIVISSSRHRAIASSRHRHRAIAPSHHWPTSRWYDGAIVKCMALSGFHRMLPLCSFLIYQSVQKWGKILFQWFHS